MRWMIWGVGLLTVLWGGYWFAGSRAFERAAVQWFDGQRAAGLTATHAGLGVQGFPSRFDLTVVDPRLQDPATGYGWQAPFVQILSLSYRPWHVIAALPDRQTLTTPQGDVSIASSKMQASLVLVPDLSLALDRITLVATDLALSAPGTWVVQAAELRAATRRSGDAGLAHDIAVEVIGLQPDPAFLAALGPAATLPSIVDRVHLEAVAGFSAPLDRNAQVSGAHLTDLDLREARLGWGSISALVRGKLMADSTGRAEGRLTVEVENWRQLLPVLVASGAVSPELAPTLENIIAALAGAGPNPENLSIPLTFARGLVSLGPVPLGPAPLLYQPRPLPAVN